MTDRPGAADPNGPLDEDAAFAAIIAGYNSPGSEPNSPAWPASEEVEDVPAEPDSPADNEPYILPRDLQPFTTAPRGPRDYEPAAESEHYVAPPPPPRQPTHPTTKWGLATIGLGLVLLVAPWLLSIEQTDGISLLAVAAILTGIGLLVSRLRTGDDPDRYDDDGAVV